jgi:hypothetical protein
MAERICHDYNEAMLALYSAAVWDFPPVEPLIVAILLWRRLCD